MSYGHGCIILDISDQILQNIVSLGDEFGTELAIGLSGSHARGTTDAFSDLDICVFVEGDYLQPENRRSFYATLGFRDSIYFDVDFNTSRGDGFVIDGMRCDFNWMVIENVHVFLDNLDRNFDCPEWLPGGLATIKAIYDPRDIITGLQEDIPIYSIKRSQHRVQRALQDAHFSLYTLAWLPKASCRGDIFSFLKYQYFLLENFFYAIFALNRIWFSDEKRLVEKLMSFELVPDKADQRIETIIRHEDRGVSLESCLQEIKSLLSDTATCAHQVYPALDLPTTWA